jgi:hypothetical protein
MPDLTKPDNWASLTPAQRVALCHALAREAAQLAQAASPSMKQAYKEIAAKWNTLAAEIEAAQQEQHQARPGR